MAARYFVGGGTGNWNSTTNWSDTSGGASGFSFPVAGDTVFLTAVSGANTLTINVSSACTSIDCTGFTGTLAGSSQLTLSGNLTLVAGMTLTWSGLLVLNATSTIVTAGKTFGSTQFAGSNITYTLSDNLNTGGLTIGGGGTITLNGNSINASGSLTMTTQSAGTTNIVLNGTGTWSGSGSLRNGLTVNTAGTITFSGSLSFGTSTLTYTAGTTDTTGSTLTLAAVCTINVNGSTSASPSNTSSTGINFNNLTITPTATITLSSDICVVGNFIPSGSPTFAGTFGIYVSGNCTINQILNSPDTTIYLVGTGILSSSSGNASNIAIIINTNGIITFGASINKGNHIFQYLSGTVITDSNTFTINGATTTLDTGLGIIFHNLSILGNATVTLNNNDVYCRNLTHGSSNTTTVINGNNIYVDTNYTIGSTTGTQSGTTIINLVGSGLFSSSQTAGALTNTLIINSTGKYLITSNFRFAGNFSILKGYVDGRVCNFSVGTSTLVGLNKVVFRSVVVTAGATLTMKEFFNGSANIKTPISSTSTTNYTITFQDNFEKLAKFVRVSNCTLTRRGQLLITTDKGNANTLGSSNLGIRYINHNPNGISKNNPSVIQQTCFGIDDGFVNDPITRF